MVQRRIVPSMLQSEHSKALINHRRRMDDVLRVLSTLGMKPYSEYLRGSYMFEVSECWRSCRMRWNLERSSRYCYGQIAVYSWHYDELPFGDFHSYRAVRAVALSLGDCSTRKTCIILRGSFLGSSMLYVAHCIHESTYEPNSPKVLS